MTIDEQLAKIGKFQWLERQSTEDQAAMDWIKKTLRFAQAIQKAGIELDAKSIVTACTVYGQSKKKYPKYQLFINQYFEFMGEHVGIKPQMGKAQGAAMLEIIAFLIMQSKEGSEQGALDAWMYILSKWNDLTPFLQNQTKLTQISKNIQEIVTQLRNGNTKAQQKQRSTNSAARRVAERRRKRK
jgi:hypothetical protein